MEVVCEGVEAICDGVECLEREGVEGVEEWAGLEGCVGSLCRIRS